MSSSRARWSDLHEELVDLIADRLHSNIDLLRIRSICKQWRSSTFATKKRSSSNSFRRKLPLFNEKKSHLLTYTFFRVTLSSSSCSSNKGWLIKARQISDESNKIINILYPLSNQILKITSSDKTLDLLKFGLLEIQPSYNVVQYIELSYDISSKVVVINNMVFAIDFRNEIWCCKIDDQESSKWTRIVDEQVRYFSDIILHKGLIYALDDSKGAIWWISLFEDLKIYQYKPSSTTIDYYYNDDIGCIEKRLVEYDGGLCVVHRFVSFKKTVDFQVYKMDDEDVEWVEMKSLGDKAFVMAKDRCFSVLAKDYYGCLENSIYFSDEEDVNNVKVFKLCDGSITKMGDSSCDQICFQMFSPPFFV